MSKVRLSRHTMWRWRPRKKEMRRNISRIERHVKEYALKRFGTCVDDLVISRSDVVVMVVGTVLLEPVSLCLRNGMSQSILQVESEKWEVRRALRLRSLRNRCLSLGGDLSFALSCHFSFLESCPDCFCGSFCCLDSASNHQYHSR